MVTSGYGEYFFGMYDIGDGIAEFDTSGFMGAVTNRLTKVMRDGAEKIKKELENSVKDWRTPVQFNLQIDKRGDAFTMTVFTDNEIFRFVNDGTAIRYATMTPDFIPKTHPGTLMSRAGRGGLAYVNKKVPRPGIEARNFIDVAFKRWGNATEQRMENEFYRTVSEFWRKAL